MPTYFSHYIRCDRVVDLFQALARKRKIDLQASHLI